MFCGLCLFVLVARRLPDVVQKSRHKTPTLTPGLGIMTCLLACNDGGSPSITASAAAPHEEAMGNDSTDSGD